MPNLDALNWVPVHVALSFAGFVFCLYLMQLVSRGAIGADDKGCVRFFRRLSMAIIAGGMLWSLAYGFDRNWQPWPPFLLLMLGVDMAMLNSIVGAYWFQKHQPNRPK